MDEPAPVLLLALSLGPGGTELQMTGMATHLDRSQFEPHVCVFRAGWMTPDEFRAVPFRLLHLPVHSFKSWSAVRYGRELFRYIRRHRIVLTHSWDWPTNVFSFPVAKAARVDVVLTSQRADRALVPQPYLTILRMLDRMADGIVVDSQFLVNHMIHDEKASASRVFRSFNGIDIERFSPGRGPRPPGRERAGPVVGVVCLLRPEKNVQLLLRAFTKVRQLRPGLKLIVVGSGPELASLLKLRADLGLDESTCSFEPATKDVPYWLRAIDIFVLPSTSEAFANSLVEAMATGCCVMAASIDGNVELIDDGRTGLLFRNNDVDSLASGLTAAIENETLRKRLGENATQSIRERFSWQSSARNMGRIYAELLQTRARR
jgi:glycosyltransferase involved in cell wall biosynthesis